MRAIAAILSLVAAPAFGDPSGIVLSAKFDAPTTRYDHGILGDAVEWGALVIQVDTCPDCAALKIETRTFRLPQTRVFEDLAPRLIQDENGVPLVMVVESDLGLGARLALYNQDGVQAATPFIGRPHRWLAPIGAADLDGDGAIEIAYIDRPHLAKTLRIWRFENGALVPVASATGLTNHRIGWDFIPGGIRDCGQGPEIIVASGNWAHVMAVKLQGTSLVSYRLGPYLKPEDLAAAMACKFPQ